ncbi:MAG: hypothetical protein EOO89_15590, partial [Pedobacter sp.]
MANIHAFIASPLTEKDNKISINPTNEYTNGNRSSKCNGIIIFTLAEINPKIAEARFVRAFAYFHLVRVFGDVPYIDFFITNPEAVKQLGRTPAATVYTAIIGDLEFAKQWLPEKQPADVRSRPTKGTAASYLAVAHLTLQDYAKAYAEAKYVIDNKDKFGYGLEADFQTLFRAPQANN